MTKKMMTKIRIFCLVAVIACSCLNMAAQSAFEANQIQVKGMDAVKEELKLLGENEYGQQIWYGNFKTFGELKVWVNGSSQVLKGAVYYNSRHYGEDAHVPSWSPWKTYYTRVSGDGIWYVLVYGETHVELLSHYTTYSDKTTDPTYKKGVRLCPTTKLTADEPVYDSDKAHYTQTISWNIGKITDVALSTIDISASYDGGSTWTEIHKANSCNGTYTLEIPYTADKVQYKATTNIKSDFQGYLQDDKAQMSCLTPTYSLKHLSMPVNMSVGELKKNYNETGSTCTTDITWSIPSKMEDAFDSGVLEYCLYPSGKHWEKLTNLSSTSGKETVTLPVGNDSILFRITANCKSDCKVFNASTATEALATIDYEPTFNNLAIDGDLEFDSETGCLAPTLTYSMNEDLYQTKTGPAYIYYSTNDGRTWTLAKTIDAPKQSDGVSLTLPANGDTYKFRMYLANTIDNIISVNEITSDDYPYTATSGLDVKITAAKYATTCLPWNGKVPEGVTVYIATQYNEGETSSAIHLEKYDGTVLPKGKGFILYSDNAGIYTFKRTTDAADDPTANILSGTYTKIANEDLDFTNYDYMLLGNKSKGVGFYRLSADSYIPAYRAYILRDKATEAKVEFTSFDFTPTGINGIHTDTSATVNAIYGLSGERRNTLEHGFNVVKMNDGSVKKVIVK